MDQIGFTQLLCLCLALCTAATAFTDQANDEDDGGKHWALLVAGSACFSNYRHQADICHAYHVISKHGIPDERIIVMMYDDIAYSMANPIQGNIINEPNGPNLYPGVPKDYTKEEVTPDIFLKVLTGDKEGIRQTLGREGKVIESGPKDRIFVNFADHGAPALLGFPSDVLHAEDLHKAIQEMHNDKKYKQMVFYVEACESGSMFDNILEKDINVFVTTAANPDESSYACYFDDKRGTYLGDVYSVMWMQDSDKENLNKESLNHQFELVKKETNTSHVQEYGDLKMGKLKVADFQGNLNSNSLYFTPAKVPHPAEDAVPSESVHLEILKKKISKSTGDEQDRHVTALESLLKSKVESESFFKAVLRKVLQDADLESLLEMPLQFTDFKCYRKAVDLIQHACPNMKLSQNDFALRKLRVLANLCELELSPQLIWEAVVDVSATAEICQSAREEFCHS